jgi:hypothetical protein
MLRQCEHVGRQDLVLMAHRALLTPSAPQITADVPEVYLLTPAAGVRQYCSVPVGWECTDRDMTYPTRYLLFYTWTSARRVMPAFAWMHAE